MSEEYEGEEGQNVQHLKIELDTSPELQTLRKYQRWFEEDVDLVMRKAKAVGIEAERPTDKMELALLVGQIQDAKKTLKGSSSPLASGQTPLTNQYGSEQDTSLYERQYASYQEMCIDLKNEAKAGNPEAQKILNRLLVKEMKKQGSTSGEFYGKITDLQKQPHGKLSLEAKDEVDEKLKKEIRKWRVPQH